MYGDSLDLCRTAFVTFFISSFANSRAAKYPFLSGNTSIISFSLVTRPPVDLVAV